MQSDTKDDARDICTLYNLTPFHSAAIKVDTDENINYSFKVTKSDTYQVNIVATITEGITNIFAYSPIQISVKVESDSNNLKWVWIGLSTFGVISIIGVVAYAIITKRKQNEIPNVRTESLDKLI